MIARHVTEFAAYGIPRSTYYAINRVIDDFGNEIILRLVDNGEPSAQSRAIHAFLRGPLH